jgi:hypothetical protein
MMAMTTRRRPALPAALSSALVVAMLAAPLATAPALAATGDMTIGAFLNRYEALRKKGIMALASPDVGRLKAEGEAAGLAYAARLRADKAAGRPPHSCGPAKGRLTQSEFLNGVQRYPASMHGQMTLKDAVADLMRKKYPCKG